LGLHILLFCFLFIVTHHWIRTTLLASHFVESHESCNPLLILFLEEGLPSNQALQASI
jgi:hypothetical protein